MSTIFIAGSIAIKHIPDIVKARIDNIIKQNFPVLLGDANGVDAAVQAYLAAQQYANVSIYCSGKRPRNRLLDWPVRHIQSAHAAGTRKFFTEKDRAMASDANYGLMIWDATSTGSLSNVLELLAQGKKSLVFLQPSQEFWPVTDLPSCKALLANMSEQALQKADQKMGLQKKLAALAQAQAEKQQAPLF